jgi:acyl carrier protein
MTPDLVLQRLRLCLPRFADALSPDRTLADLALDSMDTVELLCAIHEEFNVRLTETEFQPQQPLARLLEAVASKASPKPETNTLVLS